MTLLLLLKPSAYFTMPDALPASDGEGKRRRRVSSRIAKIVKRVSETPEAPKPFPGQLPELVAQLQASPEDIQQSLARELRTLLAIQRRIKEEREAAEEEEELAMILLALA